MTSLPVAATRIRNEPESVWVEFIQLALDYKPLNLGQGFPDFAAPKYLIESLHKASNQSDPSTVLNHQYARSFGHPRLIKALVRYYNEFRGFKKLDNANEQVLVTVGAYEALYCAVMAFVEPDDEVLILDPAFDAYEPMVKMANGKSVFIPLRQKRMLANNESIGRLSSADFGLDMNEFKSKITNKTKMLILNTPNNPLGKMFSLTELKEMAKLCIENNILVVADEVYEQMYYDSNEHISIASLPSMWDRTITIGSAGKTFSVTGWKIGWAYGPRHLLRYLQLVHQTAVYTVATLLQESVARSFEHEMALISERKESDYWSELRSDLYQKRDRMAQILERAQMRPIVPQGGYFMVADFAPLASRLGPKYVDEGHVLGRPNTNDYKFVRWLSRVKGLQGIPASAFYSEPNKGLASDLVRFCFIKKWDTLDSMERLMDELRRSLDGSGSSHLGAAGKLERSKL